MKKIIYIPLLFAFIIFMNSCSEDNPVNLESTQSTSKVIGIQGGIIESENGIVLEIPEGALTAETEIRMTPLNGSSFGELGIIGVKLEPNQLTFAKNGKLKLPLPVDWNPDERPMIYDSPGEDPADFLPLGELVEVVGLEGEYYCEIEVSHFSSLGAARNCHAGTFDFLVNDFVARGCSLNDITSNVTEKHGAKFKVERLENTGEFNVDDKAIQSFLDIYFNDQKGFAKDENIPDSFIANLKEFLSEGRQVVLAFAKSWYDSDSDGFYNGYAHTGVLENINGELKLRQSVSVNSEIIDMLIKKNGKNVLWYPKTGSLTAQNLNEFRNLQTCVGLEEELCGSPGCLWQERPVENRPKPYEAVRFYVSKFSGDRDPCDLSNELQFTKCWVNVTIGSSVWERKQISSGDVYNSYTSGNSFGGVTFEGSFSDNKFIGYIDRTREFDNGNDTTKGSITVQLNDRRDIVLSLEFNIEQSSYFDPVNSHSYFYNEFEGKDIPIESTSSTGTFSVQGTETCGHINQLEMFKRYIIPDSPNSYEETLQSFECNVGYEEIKIYFSN